MAQSSGHTLLRKYLTQKGLSQADLSRIARINSGYLSSLLAGDRSAGLAVALRIERATHGAVPVKSWLAGRLTA